MNRSKIHILLLLALMACFFCTDAQNDKKKLQNQYNQLINEIASIEKTIQETQSKRTKSTNEVKSLTAKIDAREDLIENINSQITRLEGEISETEQVISSMEKDIVNLKQEYAEMVYYAYKNNSNVNPLLFVLSAESFNEAINRVNYMRKYSAYRKNQSGIIESTINTLSKKNADLKEKKSEQVTLAQMQQKQKTQLVKEKTMINTVIMQLTGEESLLKKEIKKKNQDAAALNQRIKKIIEEEIRLAKEREAKKNAGKSSGGLALTPAEKALSSDFTGNKNKLPWPVSRGHIVDKFGKQPHPQVPSVYVNNNGVGIRTETGSEVHAIFDGKVVSVFYLPTEQNSVIVKHGEYFSVYSNLSEVYVNPDDMISTKQKIGKAYTETSDNSTIIDLQIWKGTAKLNPELWLSRF